MVWKKTLTNPRALAVACLAEVEKGALLVPEAMARQDFELSDENRNFAYEVVYGTFRFLPGLRHLTESLCKTHKLPVAIRWLLLSSLYQLRFMRVPDYAVLDEANKLAQQLGYPKLKGLVNGVLRNAQRRGEPIWEERDAARRLLPDWLYDLFVDGYGSETVNAWLPAWERRAALSYWTADGQPLAEDTASENLPHAFRTNRTIRPQELQENKAYVQNESSQAVAEMILRLTSGRVLDLCAAPGGKCCYLAAFGELEHLQACDSAPNRIALLEQNQKRLGLNFPVQRIDACDLKVDEAYDLVLLDAPCSGIGIIGRHPEIKFLKHAPAGQKLQATQEALTKAAWSFVKPGGYLLYTVCSLDPEELPDAPEGCQVVDEETLTRISKGFPCVRRGDGFYFPPTEVFDGFSGILWEKPSELSN